MKTITEQDARHICNEWVRYQNDGAGLSDFEWDTSEWLTALAALLNKLNADRVPAEDPLADKIFASSDKKATDRWKKCPACNHECEKVPAVSVPEPSERDVYLWFQESAIVHHIEENGGHISKRAMYIAKKAYERAMLSASLAPEASKISRDERVNVCMTGEQLAYLWLMLRHSPMSINLPALQDLLEHVRTEVLRKTVEGRFLLSGSDWVKEPVKYKAEIETFLIDLFKPAPDTEGSKGILQD